MALIAPLIVLAASLATLLIAPPNAPILGLSHAAFASAAMGVAMVAFLIAGGGALSLLRGLLSAAFWAIMLFALWYGYENRLALGGLANLAIDSLSEAEPSVGASGEVTIKRRLSGEFLISAKVNDRPVRFLFDTGATTVVLTAEDAERIGIDASRLDFDADVLTANGAALAAPTRLARVSVGPIIVRNVTALVTRPGAMEESLLGMSFLEQLESYKVERGRLTLKGR